ncbi:MAG: caspase family protein [Chloroflexaceae bacterium]|nr:caspase family protein [Chloroflexaceae bacterium]
MPFPHGHALIIGVGTYQHEPRLNVPTTTADAQAVSEVLRDPRFCGYPVEQVTLLTDGQATRAAILAALDNLPHTKPTDTLLLFYSGHGHYSADGTYHLTTHDTHLDGGKVVASTAISQTELLERLRAAPAERVLLLFNACHAGEVSPVLGEGDAPFTGTTLPPQTADALLSTGSGRIIITACREQQVSFIGPGPLTLFAQALTDGLRGQGFNGRAGFISAYDLYTHLFFAIGEAVERHISPALKQQYGDTQEPELTVFKGVGPFAVALYRGASALGDFPTDHTPAGGTVVREVNPARSQWALQQAIQQTVSGTGAVGVVGNVSHSPITTGSGHTVIQSGRDTVHAGGDVTQVGGDSSGQTVGVSTGNMTLVVKEIPAQPPHLNTRFEGLTPNQPLPVGQRVPLVVWVGTPTGQRSERFQFTFPDDHTPVEFTVHLHAVPDAWTVRVIEPTMIVAPPGTTTQEAEFLVTAKQPGRDTLFLTVARADTSVTVQHLCLPVYAVREAAAPPRPLARERIEVSFPLEDPTIPRRQVEIALHPGEEEGFTVVVRADLDGHTLWETYRVPVSAEAIQNAALRLRQELEHIVFYPGKQSGGPFPFASLDTLTVDETLSRQTAVPLADAGQQVWHLLFQSPRAPAELKQFAADLRDLPHGSSVQMVLYSQRFIIPWTLLYDQPGTITADTLDWAGFWGYRYRLEVIPPGNYPALTITDQPPGWLALFNDDASLRTFTATQEQFFRTMLGSEAAHSIWGDTAVRQVLRTPEAAVLLYCYCHGTHTSGAMKATALASESALSFSTGTQVRLADLRRLPAAYFAQRPLVFLNACEGATQDAFYYDGFMPYFIEELGARGFIGTEVKAPVFLAHEVALRFLEAFAAGQEVGEILWRLRRHYLDAHHNILAFNYSLYCPGGVRLERGRTEPGG